MKPYRVFVCHLFLLVSLSFQFNLLAQDTRATQFLPKKGNAKEGNQEAGFVDIMVFNLGVPKSNQILFVKGKNQTTDADGFLSLPMLPGRHELIIPELNGEKRVFFNVVSRERTQLIVNLMSRVDIIEPEITKENEKESQGKLGFLRGEVRAVGGGLISGARVFVKGFDKSTQTNAVGVFELELPEGLHVLSLTHGKYSTEVLRNIEVKAKETVVRKIAMTPTGLVLDEFVVLAPRVKGSIEALIEVRRKSSSVADVMSAEQISKSGDSDAAASLRRVTGLTLVDGKYVYVRGLGERYSSTLLNGISLPSPDPTRRVVPMDIFPVQILDSMYIQKSFSPDMPGEFGGGTVVLNTKSMPDQFFLKMGVGQSYHSNVETIKSTTSGRSDWIGLDDGDRALPNELASNRESTHVFLSRNRHDLQNGSQDTLPEMSLAMGDSFRWKPLRLGYTLSVGYSDSASAFKEKRQRFLELEDGVLSVDAAAEREKIQRTRNIGGIAGLSATLLKKHKFHVDFVQLRKSTDYVAILEGTVDDIQVRETDREWAEREVTSTSIRGENPIPFVDFLKLNWHVAQASARRYEPDKITDQYVANEDGGYRFRAITEPTAYQRRFFDLNDISQDTSVALTSDLPWFYGRKGSVAIGRSFVQKERDSGMRRFGVTANDEAFKSQSVINGGESLDEIFAQCRNCFSYSERTRPTDFYDANQKIQSTFLKSQLPLLRSLNLSMGVRLEESEQNVRSYALYQDGEVKSFLRTRNTLPGTSLTWSLADSMQIRAAYSETVSRPDFKELSNTLWRDFELGYDVEGNPNLKSAVIKAYDLRWEWYFTRKENVSLGFFYKDFENPVEQIFTPGSDNRITYVNAAGARNLGLEFEASKNLGFAFGSWANSLTLTGNYALIQSEISLENATQAILASEKRPLQGQSEYTANILLDYSHKPWKMDLSLAYNVYGKRIALLDPNGLPDIYENPFHQVDFVFSKKMGKNSKISGKIKNILNPNLRFTQGSKTWRELRRGVNFSLGISMEI